MTKPKFTKKNIHTAFLSNDIDAAIFKRQGKISMDTVAVVLANRLGEVLKTVNKKENLVKHCIDLIRRKVE